MTRPTKDDYAVKLGQDPSMGLESQQAFPFIYTFVNHNDDRWAPVAAGTQPSLANLGPLVPAGATRHVNVLLDPDCNFKLLAIRYDCMCWNSQNTRYEWYENEPAGVGDGMDPDENRLGTPLRLYLAVTVSLQSSGARILYGGPNLNYTAGGARLPLPVADMQGYDSGFMAVRTPTLLPLQEVICFEITNVHPTKDLYVYAAIYGMKIRI